MCDSANQATPPDVKIENKVVALRTSGHHASHQFSDVRTVLSTTLTKLEIWKPLPPPQISTSGYHVWRRLHSPRYLQRGLLGEMREKNQGPSHLSKRTQAYHQSQTSTHQGAKTSIWMCPTHSMTVFPGAEDKRTVDTSEFTPNLGFPLLLNPRCRQLPPDIASAWRPATLWSLWG